MAKKAPIKDKSIKALKQKTIKTISKSYDILSGGRLDRTKIKTIKGIKALKKNKKIITKQLLRHIVQVKRQIESKIKQLKT